MRFNELQLKVENLWAGFPSLEEPDSSILRGMDFSIHFGEILGLMGPSGCGKTLTALTIMGLAEKIGAKVTSGRILFFCDDTERSEMDLIKIRQEDFQKLRGRQISMIWQNPVGVLDPVVTVGRQLRQTIAFYHGWERRLTGGQRERLESEMEEILELCGLSGVHGIREKYPGQLSVGMCQRVSIGLGICGKPKLLIADEPTASLDHDSRDGIFDTLFMLRRELGMSILLITHDEKKCRESADRIIRMEKGRVVGHE